MPVAFDEIGIQSLGTALVEQVTVEKSLDHKVIKASDSGFGAGKTFDPTYDFSVKGRGSCPVAAVLGYDGGLPDTGGMTGGVGLISNVKEGEKNDDYNDFEYSGKYFPNA